MNTEAAAKHRTPRLTPFRPGERIANWTILEYHPSASGRLREGIYTAKPDCCGEPRPVRYVHLMNAHRHQSELCRSCANSKLADRRWQARQPPAIPSVVAVTPDNWVSRLPVPASLTRDLWGRPCLSF